jgi:hypothetical protein
MAFGFAPRPIDYDAYVALHLNIEYVSTARTVETVDAMRIATGKREMPREWIELLAKNPTEAARWRNEELRDLWVG